MTDPGLPWWGMVQLAEQVTSGQVSAVEVVRTFLERSASRGAELGCWLARDAEGALAHAVTIDRARLRGESLGPLAGVPLGLKDNLCTRGIPTTCASRMLEGYVPPYDAHVVERVRRAGAIPLGKTNMDEFAMGSSSEHSAFGPTRNPWDPSRVPGGSSGGSAAATAAGLVPGALGSDTGGSVRQPAAFCGVTAIKPTYGRVSRHGLVAFASSLDQIGPLARSPRDVARLLGAIAGHDPRDATSADRPVDDYEAECGREVRGMRIGIVREQLERGNEPDVAQAVRLAAERLEALGCTLVEVELPNARHAVSVYYLIAPSEASSNLARFDGIRYGLRVQAPTLTETYERTRAAGFGPEVRRRIMLGTYALSAGYYEEYYLRAQKVRTLLRRDYEQAFERCDAVLTPTAPSTAFALGEKVSDPLSMYLADVHTLPPSLAGLPALSTPCGFSAAGLPIGLQLVGRAFAEGGLLRLAHAFAEDGGLAGRRPRTF